MNRFKSNKGISLASVLVTVVIMIIILSSIIYSRGQTNEVKKAMLLNSDIEELTKKVELYYLEKQTLPMLENENSKFSYWEDTNNNGKKDEPVYYRLQISLLENLTLNNKEIIDQNKEDTDSLVDGDKQWYVINKETHTIYFVKKENEKGVPQKAKYSSEYAGITAGATENNIEFNKPETAITQVSGETTINPSEDKIIEDASGLNVGIVEGENGTNTSPEEISGSGTAHYTYANYIGWDKTGTTATNLVLQYDGEYNAGKTGSYHNSSTTTWVDLTGNGYDGTIVSGNSWKLRFYDRGTKKGGTNIVNWIRMVKNRTVSSSYQWTENNSLKLSNNSYVVVDGYQYNGVYNYNSSTSYNNYISNTNTLTNIPDNAEPYTMEIVFYNKGPDDTTSRPAGLIGMGTYGNSRMLDDINSSDTNIAFKTVRYENLRGKIKLQLLSTLKTETLRNYIIDYRKRFMQEKINLLGVQSERTNAFRISDSGKGLQSYYWDNDYGIDEISDFSTGVHTATVKYDETNTSIYLDGKLIGQDAKHPNTLLREITIGATNMGIIASYYDNISPEGKFYQLDSPVAYESDNGVSDLHYVWNTYKNQSNYVDLVHSYSEFLNSDVYSVRIYNRALTNSEIKYNYITDYYRFGSGT